MLIQEKKKQVQFFFGNTKGKELKEILKNLLRDGDSVIGNEISKNFLLHISIAVPFSTPEQMEWVKCVEPEILCKYLNDNWPTIKSSYENSIKEAIEKLNKYDDCLLVVCGSLYLVNEFYKTV